MDEVIMRLLLLHGQLELTNYLFNLYLQYYILSLFLRQPVLQFYYFEAFVKTNFISRSQSFFDVIQRLKHDFSSQ